MTEYGPSINVPEWNGTPKQVAEVWRLRKDNRHASCVLMTHPIGAEAKVSVDNDLIKSKAMRNPMVLMQLALDWKEQFLEKGWT